jgi:photosystem II stability/assembly factor-like uncharacterized protein
LSQSWTLIGPDGGDARAMAAVPGHPEHLYVGTTNSLIYDSVDEGRSWRQLAHLDNTDDLVVDHILVDVSDTSTIFAAAWKFDHPDGGLWISHNGGRTFTEAPGLHGQSIRAFAQSFSDPNILVAGTLKGIYRTNDAGAHWELISPTDSKEIHEVESIAIDPKDPKVIYAGTWHLPWKTTDGGEHWVNIKQGVIDDSDVFSIIVDPHHSSTAYLSACSGIYKTENAGGLFRKVQGIPATARRTRVLHQDPAHRDTVYAGTTEGLYKTTDGGRTFRRITGPDVIINDVFVDPSDSDHILLATDRSGILYSTDGGAHFEQANAGFHERKVEALLVDANSPSRLYAGVVNDKTYGGVFVSNDGGANWKQTAEGLNGRDIFVLSQSADGHIFAGTNSGIFTLADDAWHPANTIANTSSKAVPEVLHGKKITVEKKVKEPARLLSGRVFALDLSGDAWAAATTSGLFTSIDQGATWQGGMVMGFGEYTSITSHGSDIAASRYNGVLYSHDAGQNWWPLGIPTAVTRIYRATFSSDGTLWIGSREGVYFTRDKGKTWMWVHRLPLVDVSDLYYDAKQNKVLVSSRTSDFIYAIDASTLSWTWRRTGYKLFLVRSNGGRLLAASLDQGVLAEPEGQSAQSGQQ